MEGIKVEVDTEEANVVDTKIKKDLVEEDTKINIAMFFQRRPHQSRLPIKRYE
jgi:hypothetical protein